MKTLVAKHPENSSTISFCEEYIHSQKPKFVFGINQYAEGISNTIDIVGFIDDFTDKKEHLGKPIFKLDEIPKKALVLSTSTMRPLTVQEKLNKHGVEHLDYFSFFKHAGLNLTNVELWDNYEQEFQNNREHFERFYSLLEDEKSRETYWKLVNFKLSYDLSYMKGFEEAQHRQYFEDFLNLQKNDEVFADIGGFDGYTTREFIKHCPNFKQVLFFEPFDENMSTAKQKLKNEKRIMFFRSALSNRCGTLYLSPDGSATKIGDRGPISIKTQKLDDIKSEKITFLKMDVEGAESEVIDGAKKVIQRDHPRLAISAYHKPSDFWKIPKQILRIRDDYKIYMRHYTEGKDETVFFFIPKI